MMLCMEDGEMYTKNPSEQGERMSEFAQEALISPSPEIPPTPLPPDLAEAFTIAEKPVPTEAELEKIYNTMDGAGCVYTPMGEFPFGVVADNPDKYGFVVEHETIEGGDEPPVAPAEIPAPMRVVQEKEGEDHPLESIEDPEMRALQDKVTKAQTALRHEEELPWTVQDNQYRIPYARIVLERARQNLDRYRLNQELAHTEERENTIRGFLAEQARRRMVDDLETQILWNNRGIKAYTERVARTERGILKLQNELDSLPTGARDRAYLEDEMERLEGEYKNLQMQRAEYDALEQACASRIEEVHDVLARDRSQFDVPRAMGEDHDFKACLREVEFSASDDEALRKVVSGEDPRKKAEALFRKRFPQKADYYASKSESNEPVDTAQVVHGASELPQVTPSLSERLKTMTPKDVEAVNPALFSDENTPTLEQSYTVASQQTYEAGDGDSTSGEEVSVHGVEETEHVGNDESAEHMTNIERSGEGSDSEFLPFEEPSERHDKEDDSYPPRTSIGERLLEYLTGLTLEHPEAVLSRLEEDRSVIRAKYGLPARAMRFRDPVEYERVLYKKAREYGVSIRPADEFGDFFTAHSYAQGVTDEASNRIGAGFGVSSRDDYERKLGVLEHEIIHAGQALHSPGMPIEVREYEAYVAGSSFDHLHGLEANEMRESLEVFFSMLVGGSVMHEYSERGADPVWNTSTFFESAGDDEKNP